MCTHKLQRFLLSVQEFIAHATVLSVDVAQQLKSKEGLSRISVTMLNSILIFFPQNMGTSLNEGSRFVGLLWVGEKRGIDKVMLYLVNSWMASILGWYTTILFFNISAVYKITVSIPNWDTISKIRGENYFIEDKHAGIFFFFLLKKQQQLTNNKTDNTSHYLLEEHMKFDYNLHSTKEIRTETSGINL